MQALAQPIMMGVLRHLLTWAAGLIVAKGWLDEDTAMSLLGALIGLIGAFWSAQDKKNRTLTPHSLAPVQARNVDVHQLPQRLDETVDFSPPVQQVAPPPTTLSQADSTTVESGFVLSDRSLKNLEGVHPSLVDVVKLALSLSRMDFVVIEGLRSTERQKELLAQGKSWIKRSAHQDGVAVDLMALPADGSDNWLADHYSLINAAMQEAALRLNVRLTWGGHWKVRDYVHFQLEGV